MKHIILTGIAAFFILAGMVRASSLDESRKSIELGILLSPNASFDKDISYIIMGPEASYDIRIKENIFVPLTVYRGATLKRTIYAWIEDIEGNRVSSKSKHSLPERFTSYNLSAQLNFSKCVPSGNYIVAVEGLGLNVTKTVALDFIGCNTTAAVSDGKISFSVINSADTVESGVQFTTRILASNPTDQDLELDAWSYVYRSSTCYSGEREQNMKTINLPSFSNVTFNLENTVIAPPGEYNLKIKLLRSDQKTPKEMTLPLKIEGNDSSDDSNVSEGRKKELLIKSNEPALQSNTSNSSATKRKLFSFLDSAKNESSIVYESSSAKARRLTVYFLIAALALVLAALVLKRL